jgi:hypothetical protein
MGRFTDSGKIHRTPPNGDSHWFGSPWAQPDGLPGWSRYTP